MIRLLLALSFIQSFATVLLERGLYFYTEERLAFTDAQNLTLALVFGLTYAAGALGSHKFTARRGERPTLRAVLLGLLLLQTLIALRTSPVVVWLGFAGIGLLEGMKWPIFESYLTAGASPERLAKIVGRFNVAWSSAMPLGLIVSGPLMASAQPTSFILLAAAIHLVTLGLIAGLPRVPIHLAPDHPARPGPEKLRRYRALMVSSRWSMLGGCAMMFLLAPLLPTLFTDRLGHAVRWAPGLSSVIDASRLGAFVLLGLFTAWRGLSLPLAVTAVGAPAGFVMVLFAPTTAVALLGQAVFGLCIGMTYYAALYHGMVLHNASVRGGGHHEALIGSGFALGPAVGLLGIAAARGTGNLTTGMALAVAPFLLLCLFASLRPLIQLYRFDPEPDPCPAPKARGPYNPVSNSPPTP
ncbi:MAG: MFS transporter [Planctomycetota bacterium]